MNKKLSVLRRITAVVLCVTLLSSQVVVANAEDSERMNVQTNSEFTDISEQDGFSSDTSEISDITESDIPDSFEGESEPNTDIQHRPPHRGGGVKLLRRGHKLHFVLLKEVHHLRKCHE